MSSSASSAALASLESEKGEERTTGDPEILVETYGALNRNHFNVLKTPVCLAQECNGDRKDSLKNERQIRMRLRISRIYAASKRSVCGAQELLIQEYRPSSCQISLFKFILFLRL